MCGGSIVARGRSTLVTLYSEDGPLEAEHLESRCRDCSKGFYYGYWTDTVVMDEEGTSNEKKYFKYYDEDCLESKVIFMFCHLIFSPPLYI